MALANVLFQRGCFLLHGACVKTQNTCQIILGESGAGKTTLTAAMAKKQIPILAEDITIVEFHQDTPYVLPGIPYLKLWQNSATLLHLDWQKMPTLFEEFDKRAYELTHAYCDTALPLEAVQVLKKAPIHQVSSQPIESFDNKLNIIVENIHYPHFFVGYPFDEIYTEKAVKLVESTSFYSLTRPEEGNSIPDLIQIFQKEHTLSL